jgi:CRP-like cAMP-binding protein
MTTMPTRSQLKKNLRALIERLEGRPMDLDARMRVARTYRLLGDKKEAVAHYRTVARYLSLSAQPLQAIAVLKELLQVDPKHEETLLFLAKLYARSGLGETSRGRVATPILDPHAGGALALPEGLPSSATGVWRAIRARSTDVHAAIATESQAPPNDDASIAAEMRALENEMPIDEDDVLEERELSIPPVRVLSLSDGDVVVEPEALVPDADGFEILGALTTEDILLPQVPLFSSLSPVAFIDLGHAMVFHRAKAGHVVFRQGDPGDSCIVVSRGELRAFREGAGGETVDLMKLGEGDIAGVFALMASERRQATLVANTDAEYFEIDRLAVRALVDKYPVVEKELFGFFRERLLLNLLAILPHFQTRTSAERQELAARFIDRVYEPDDELFYEGAHRAGLWVLLEGRVSVSSEKRGAVANLVTGDFIGSIAGTDGADDGKNDDETELSAVAAVRTVTCLLPHKDVEEMLSLLPDIESARVRFKDADMLLTPHVFAGNARIAGNLTRLDVATAKID